MPRYQTTTRRRTTSVPRAWQQQPERQPATSTADLVALFDAVAGMPYEEDRHAWDQVLRLLNLDLRYQLAVALVLQQGRWRNKDNPRAYIATAAYRQAHSMQLPDYTDQDMGIKRVAASGGPAAVADSQFQRRTEDGKVVDLIEEASADLYFGAGIREDESDPFSGAELKELAAGHAEWERARSEGRFGFDLDRADEGRTGISVHAQKPGAHDDGLHLVDDEEDGYAWEQKVPAWLYFEDSRSHINWQTVATVVAPKAYMRPNIAAVLGLRFDRFAPAWPGARYKLYVSSDYRAAKKWINRHWNRIRTVILCATEQEAREKLRGGAKRPPAAPKFTAPADALCSVIARARQRSAPEGQTPQILTWERYGG